MGIDDRMHDVFGIGCIDTAPDEMIEFFFSCSLIQYNLSSFLYFTTCVALHAC